MESVFMFHWMLEFCRFPSIQQPIESRHWQWERLVLGRQWPSGYSWKSKHTSGFYWRLKASVSSHFTLNDLQLLTPKELIVHLNLHEHQNKPLNCIICSVCALYNILALCLNITFWTYQFQSFFFLYSYSYGYWLVNTVLWFCKSKKAFCLCTIYSSATVWMNKRHCYAWLSV